MSRTVAGKCRSMVVIAVLVVAVTSCGRSAPASAPATTISEPTTSAVEQAGGGALYEVRLHYAEGSTCRSGGPGRFAIHLGGSSSWIDRDLDGAPDVWRQGDSVYAPASSLPGGPSGAKWISLDLDSTTARVFGGSSSAFQGAQPFLRDPVDPFQYANDLRRLGKTSPSAYPPDEPNFLVSWTEADHVVTSMTWHAIRPIVPVAPLGATTTRLDPPDVTVPDFSDSRSVDDLPLFTLLRSSLLANPDCGIVQRNVQRSDYEGCLKELVGDTKVRDARKVLGALSSAPLECVFG